MTLINLKIEDFSTEVASNKPAPGGGSVSALMANLGTALTRMVGALTITKKRFLRLDEEIKQEFNNNLEAIKTIQEQLKILIDEDTKAYNKIVAAFKIPKDNEERQEKIKKATIAAIEVPLEILRLALKALTKIPVILKYGNPNAISDLGVAALALSSGAEGGAMNVLINLIGFEDETLKAKYQSKTTSLITEVREIKEIILTKVYQELA